MITLPSRKQDSGKVLAAMHAARDADARWQEGKTWSLVFHAGEEITELLKEAYSLFFLENGLNPMAFPSLRKFEAEVIAMTAALLGGDEHTAGNMTSGGTESILLAVKCARDWAREHEPAIEMPEILLPASAHPAFDKAGHYFGVKVVRVPVGPDFRADVEGMRAALTKNTIMLVASAPSYPQGVVDPVIELAELAQDYQILCHVDACVGGFMLPFVAKLGYDVPAFDFAVTGVTSLSVDLHKYGYAAKGASVILYRSRDLRRRQFFIQTDWSGGIYASPGMGGTRPGGAIAAAWAIMNYLGEEGYLAITETVMETTHKIKAGVVAIPGLQTLGDPPMSILAIGSDKLNIYEVGDELGQRGWHLDRQQFPASLHLTVTYAHAAVADEFLVDLAAAAKKAGRLSLPKVANSVQVGLVKAAARVLPEKVMSDLTARVSALIGVSGGTMPNRSAAMYGMMANLPNRGDLNEMVLDILDDLTRLDDPPQP